MRRRPLARRTSWGQRGSRASSFTGRPDAGRNRRRLNLSFTPAHHKEMGSSGVRVTPLTLAAWSFAGRTGPLGASLSPADVERSFHDLGLRSFFLSPGMLGLARGVRSLVRQGRRDELAIVTPAGLPSQGRIRAYWRRCCRVLEIDHIDVLLMGWVQAPWYLRPRVWDAMQEMKRQGRVGAVGFSIHNRSLAARLARTLDPPADVLMIRYNAAHRGAEVDVFEQLPSPPPGIIAYTSTRWGDLLKPRPDQGFPRPMTASECYRFSLARPQVNTVLCAPRTWSELEEDVEEVLSGPLTADRFEEVLRFGDAVHRKPRRRSSRLMFDR